MKLEDKIFIVNRGETTKEKFFQNAFPGCDVDSNTLIFEEKEYWIIEKEPMGTIEKDCEYYVLEVAYDPQWHIDELNK